jgi:hypothetical protein
LSFAGAQAINAVFAISVTALYVAYSIPITARWVFLNGFKNGPFSLGIFVSPLLCLPAIHDMNTIQSFPVSLVAVLFMILMTVVFLFPTTPDTTVADMNYTAVVLGGVLVLSLVYYYLPVYGGIHWFQGPVRNVDTCEEATRGEKRVV